MFGLGFQEILLLLLIALLLFGAAKLPEVGKSLGKTVREFKKALKNDDKEKPEDGKDDKPQS